MAQTYVEHIHEGSGSNSGMGFLLGVVFLIVFMFLMFYYGLPVIRNGFGGSPQINIPSKGQLDVNVKQSK